MQAYLVEQSIPSNWKASVDSSSGRQYYSNIVTGELSWTKPIELATGVEREQLLKKREDMREFFKVMEANILSKFEGAGGAGTCAIDLLSGSPSSSSFLKNKGLSGEIYSRTLGFHSLESKDDLDLYGTQGHTRMIRTISTIDDEFLTMYGGNNPIGLYRRQSPYGGDLQSITIGRRSSEDEHSYSRSNFGATPAASPPYPPYLQDIIDPLSHHRSRSCSSDYIYMPGMEGQFYGADIGAGVGGGATVNLGSLLTSDSAASSGSEKTNSLRRSNSMSTMFVESTLDQPDSEGTIRCVCAVMRMHMVEAAQFGTFPSQEFEVFYDDYGVGTPTKGESKEAPREAAASEKKKVGFSGEEKKTEEKEKDDRGESKIGEGGGKDAKRSTATTTTATAAAASSGGVVPIQKLPSLETMTAFFKKIFVKTQMESECIIISLVYCERLLKMSRGKFRLRFNNWKSTIFASLIMASKVWDDLSMWNVDFANVFTSSFNLQRINELECAMLDALKYYVKVSAGEYAKYYFHLRSMMARLGYVTDATPLDVAQARRLQVQTEHRQQSMLPRSMSVPDGLSSGGMGDFSVLMGGGDPCPSVMPSFVERSADTCIEQIIGMEI